MSLLSRKRVLLAKIELSYGVDPTPTGAANAILVRGNLQPKPLMQGYAPRELIRPFLGNFDQLPDEAFSSIDFEVEVAGPGTAGTAPPYGPLLRACAHSQTLLAAAHSGTLAAGGTTSVTLGAGASAVDDAYTGMQIRITGGTGSGQRRIISDYVGSTKVATIGEAFSPATDGTSTYSIDAQATYLPVSSTPESVTIYFNLDGRLHSMIGCRGTVSWGFTVKQIPVMRYRFVGIHVAPTDTAAPTPTYTGFQEPLVVNNTNTTQFRVHTFAAALSALSLDMAGELVPRALAGSGATKQVLITNRLAAGQINIEDVLVASKNFWAAIKATDDGAIYLEHGTVAGNIAILGAHQVQLTEPDMPEEDGVGMLQMNTIYKPSSVGSDDYIYIAK